MDTWRDYLTVQYLHGFAAVLPGEIDRANFAVFGTVLGGQTAMTPRDARAVAQLNRRLTDPLSRLYVARWFPPEYKASVQGLVGRIVTAYEEAIRGAEWMSPQTREQALTKLHGIRIHIGYPDTWRDYSGLLVRRDDPLGNQKRSNAFEWRRKLSRLEGTVDRDEWLFPATSADGSYDHHLNGIFFPAAVLQPPVFDLNADAAVNYGAIGAIIGHEIGHGFDDVGSQYDALGNQRNWWTPTDRDAFGRRQLQLATQFEGFEPLPGLRLNGRQTMGENMGDLFGISIAYHAYHDCLAGRQVAVLDGFTGDQRFFLGFAQVWRAKYREQTLRQVVITDPHSPLNLRVVGATRNMDAWYSAFHVEPRDHYYIPTGERVRLW